IGSLGKTSLAIKLLEGDNDLLARAQEKNPDLKSKVETAQIHIQSKRGQAALWAFDAERKGLASRLANQVVTQGQRQLTLRDHLDDFLLHPVWGYVALVLILWVFFELVYSLGSVMEGPLLASFDTLMVYLQNLIGADNFWGQLVSGAVQGIAGGVAIVLPYLVPFLLGLGFLEDVGYLSRLAFLMDALMHRFGLHGKAIVPFILGYGCNVPAVMSTRVLEERQDRFLAATMATLVPCAARLSVVFGLAAFYLGPQVAVAIYIFNLIVIAITGRLMSRVMTEKTPGLILEIPVYRLPTLKTVLHKTWFRAREFVVEAWPLLIAGSVVLELLNRLNISRWFDLLLRPFTWMLGLPSVVGVPLIFGVLRKELSLIMLRQALNVTDFSDALSPEQMVTFTVFIVFYLPCVATLAALRRELGSRGAAIIAALTVVIALVAALFARGIAILIW
ncbi:MAG: ferrous iron transporter B, partial [Chloroflexota bacterium]|nr:ferrous iron transporter B [Chloroflexota bacterium]